MKGLKKLPVATLAGLAVFAGAFGMAASLGGVTPQGLGADDAVIASCDTDGIATAYANIYNTTGSAGYKVDKVTVSGIANTCDGKAIKITLTGASNSSLEEITTTVPTDAVGTSMDIEFANSTLSESVTGVHVVISG